MTGEKLFFSGLINSKNQPPYSVLGGFYYSDASYCWDAALTRDYKGFQGPNPDYEKGQDLHCISDHCYYGGIILKHFGHFFLESLSRLSNIPSDKKAIYFSVRPNVGISSLTDLPCNSLRLLEAAVGDINRVRLIFNPCVFNNITIPKSGYRIQDYISLEHSDFMRNIGFCFKTGNKYKDAVDFYRGKKIWLSRSSLNDNIIQGESCFEEYLVENDFVIVKPESIAIEQQIAIFESASLVAGFTGTAFHPVLLCDNVGAHLFHFIRTKRDNRNFTTCLTFSNCSFSFENVFLGRVKDGGVEYIFVDFLKISVVLHDCKYVNTNYAKYIQIKDTVVGFSREVALSKILLSYNSSAELDSSLKLALNLINK